MITVEDGTGVAGANSYVSVEELENYAAARGLTLPVDEAAKEVLLIKAMDYLAVYSRKFKGVKVSDSQALDWPRTYSGVNLMVPRELKDAQLILAYHSSQIDLMPVRSSSNVLATRKTIGPITVEYEKASSASMVSIPAVVDLIGGLLGFSSAGQPLVVRG